MIPYVNDKGMKKRLISEPFAIVEDLKARNMPILENIVRVLGSDLVDQKSSLAQDMGDNS